MLENRLENEFKGRSEIEGRSGSDSRDRHGNGSGGENKLEVLYEDNHLIAVFKEHGVLVQGDIRNKVSLMDHVKDYLREKYNKKGNVFLGLLHRLDRPVSGIVLFGKTSKGAKRLSEQIRLRQIEKTYTVLVNPAPVKDEERLVHYMVKNAVKNKSWAYEEKVKGSKEAILEYKVLERREDGAGLLEVKLITGRHHQIRAQLAAIKSPIVGDSKYGSKFGLARMDRICLSASGLKFKTATTDEVVELRREVEF